MSQGYANGGVPIGIGATNKIPLWTSPTVLGDSGITFVSPNITFPGWVSASGFATGLTTVVTAAGTTTLTNASTQKFLFTGTSTQSAVLPDATTLTNGTMFEFNNQSTGIVTVKTNGGATLFTMPSGAYVYAILNSNSTAVGTWDFQPLVASNSTWGTATLAAGGNITFVNSGNGTTNNLSNYFEKEIVDVLDHGITFDGTTDDLAAWNALMSSAADSTIFILPWGTSKISGTISIPSGKHYVFQGAGPVKTFIKTSSGTLDMFSVGDWQTEFRYMSFGTTVTRTAGYAVNGGSNVSIYVTNCSLDSMFNGILMNGTICYIRECQFTNTVNFSAQFNGTTVNSFIQGCTFDGAPAAVAHVEVNLCGSLLIDNCDIIRAVNNLRINPTSSGAFSIYCCNTFFDTASGSSVKCMGTSDIQRLKFTNCWMSGSTNGIEFAGATGNNSTTGVDIVNCDIYSNSANGILATTVRDFSVSNCRIANNTTAGINVSAAAGAITKFNVQNCAIGPTGIGAPGTGPNGTGILINAGTYGGYIITGNNIAGNTTKNVNDAGVIAGQNQKQVSNNIGQPIGPQFMQAALAVTTTPVYLNNPLVLPANSLTTSSIFRVTLVFSNVATASTTTILLKFGTAGTTGDTTIATVTATGTAVADNARVTFDVNVTVLNAATGATRVLSVVEKLATATGFANALAPILVGTAVATLNTTTGANFLGIVVSTTVNAVVTLQMAYVEVIS